MHSNKDADFYDDSPALSGAAEREETTAEIESVLGTNGERRSWKKVCAARRNIERYREEQHLKALLSEAFDEDDWDELESAQIKYFDDLDDD